MVLQVPLDFVMLILAAISAYALRFTDWAVDLRPIAFDLTFADFMSLAIIVAFGWMIIFAIMGLYSTNQNRKLARDLVRVILACSVGLAGVALYIMFTQQLFDSRFLIIAAWVIAIIFVSVGRIIMRGIKGLLYRMGIGLRRVVVFGSPDKVKDFVNELNKRRELGYTVVKVFDTYKKILDKELVGLKLNEILLLHPDTSQKQTMMLLQFCSRHHMVFKYSADLFATYSSNISVSALAGTPIVELKKTPLEGWGRVAKRIFDILLSLVVIVITSPILLISSIVILIETGRPVIYKNERVGLRGEYFLTYKFRSMYQKDSTGSQFGKAGKKAEAKEQELIKQKNSKQGPIYKIKNDPRVTKFGRFIRRWSIDELPQFFNVLRGSMSIVGPRPHQPREVEAYEDNYPVVFTLKPGITGLAQISGRSDLDFEEEMRLDILYTEKWSLLQDVIIFLKTPFVLFKKRRVE